MTVDLFVIKKGGEPLPELLTFFCGPISSNFHFFREMYVALNHQEGNVG